MARSAPAGVGLTGILRDPESARSPHCGRDGPMIWASHMKTTLEIDDRLLARARRHASARGMTLRAVVEEALRARLAAKPEAKPGYSFSPPTVRGSRPPEIDVADRNALYDVLDDPR